MHTTSFTLDKNNQVRSGVPIDAMIASLNEFEKRKPGATIDDLHQVALVAVHEPFEILFANPKDGYRLPKKAASAFVIHRAACAELKREGKPSLFVGVDYAMELVTSAKPLVFTNPIDAFAPASLEARATAWLQDHDWGTSSMALARRTLPLAGAQLPAESILFKSDSDAIPRDNSDFGRCSRFLSKFPETKSHLGAMSQVSPEWAELVPQWDALETLLAKQKAGDKAAGTELYEILGKINHPDETSSGSAKKPKAP